MRLGTCGRCIRLVFLAGVVALALSTVILPRVGAPQWATTLAWTIFALLGALWLAHVVAFAFDSLRVLQQLRALRDVRLEPADAFRAFLHGLYRGAVAPLAAAMIEGCNCYFDYDCFLWRLWRVCDYSARCFRVRKGTHEVQLAVVLDCPTAESASTGSCDGQCANWRSLEAFDPNRVAGAIENYLDLFVDAASRPNAEGLPTSAQLGQLLSTLPANVGRDLRAAAFTILDVLLGWDLVMTNPEPNELYPRYRDAFLGHVADPQATPALLRAAREGLVTALRSRNADAVAPPLVEFWKRFPDYRPEHMGRCYPHGGHRYYATAIDCQIAHLRGFVAAILNARG